MRVATAALIVALGVTGSGDAGAQSERGHSLVPKTWGLVFRIGPDFQLESFRGATIGAKYQTSATRAWRGSFSLYGFDNDIEFSSTPPDSALDAMHDASSDHQYGLMIERQSYFTAGNDVHAYWTLGPRVHWRSGGTEYDPPTSRTLEYSQLDLRLGAELGGEWFAMRALSLTAAYSVSAGWFQREEEIVDQPADRRREVTTDGWSAGGEGAWLGLNVYF